MKTTQLSLVKPIEESSEESSYEVPTNPTDYYAELTRRNTYFITPWTQKKLSELKILIAGCGSTGGACIESLARAGVQHFALADNGAYELNNLNRQHALLQNIGQNKALFHAEQIQGINPYAEILSHPEGITQANARLLVQWADLIFDAVDVTTETGIDMKIHLHEVAKSKRKPVLAGLDLGFCQYGIGYDYRNPKTPALHGKLERAKNAKHPIKALFTIFPLSASPAHCLQLIYDLLKDKNVSASQLGCTSDMLSAIIVPSVIRFVDTDELINGWNINLDHLATPPSERLWNWTYGLHLRWMIKRELKRIA